VASAGSYGTNRSDWALDRADEGESWKTSWDVKFEMDLKD
jgi:hypothetical protein